MTKDLDEDLIEATIRRVAEAKAAREGAGGPLEPEPEQAPEPAESAAPAFEAPAASSDAPPVDEDLIAATIRRVAEARASQVSPEPEPAESAAAFEAPAASTDAPAVDEDLIAATIRRVAEARASQVPPEPEPEPVPAAPAEEPDVPILRIQRPAAPLHSIGAPRRDEAGDDNWQDAVAELRRELAAMRRELQALAARFDAALSQRNGQHHAPAASETADDDWDEAPQLPRLSPGLPPRPAILRDPSPRTATAEHLEPAHLEPVPDETVIDTRPIPKPLPPLHAEPRRGLDLLPRTYRITVEDKRRGVDLVPLHRALLGMDGVRDMSLLSYSNGVAIVAVEMVDEMDPHALEGAVSRAMSRGARVEVHNETTMVVKLAEE